MDNDRLIYPIGDKCKEDGQYISYLFDIRARCWYRNYFAMSALSSLVGKTYVDDWIKASINNIFIYTGEGRLKWECITALILEKVEEQNMKPLFAVKVQKSDGLEVPVYNPYEQTPMQVAKLRDVTVDHTIPINFIIEALSIRYPVLGEMIEYSKGNNNTTTELLKPSSTDQNIEDIKSVMNDLLLKNDCVLMTQSMNSKKRNNTDYIGYVKNGDLDYNFIMAKDLRDGDEKYYVHYTTNNLKPELVRGEAPEGVYIRMKNNE